MAMLMLLLAITIVTIMAKITILSIWAMALGVINMVIRGIQLKGIKRLSTKKKCKFFEANFIKIGTSYDQKLLKKLLRDNQRNINCLGILTC